MKQIVIRFGKEDADDYGESVDKLAEVIDNLPSGMYELVLRKPVRTSKQNRAMHLFFDFIANELNEKHMYFSREFFREGFETEWNSEMVKELIWRPVQMAVYGKKSSRELKTDELTKIADLIQANFSMKGIDLVFPNIDDILYKLKK